MKRSVAAIYENGILRPLEPTGLAEHQAVTLTIAAEASAKPETAQLEGAKEQDGSAVTPPGDPAEGRPWRGVFTPTSERPLLFVKEINVDPSALPCWQPQVNVHGRRDSDDAE